MREASEITSRDASEQILALIRVGYTVLTYPRVPSSLPRLSAYLSAAVTAAIPALGILGLYSL